MSKTLQEISEYFSPVQWRGPHSFQCSCPVHYDKKPSLTVSQGEEIGKIVLYCHAGCSTEDILEAVGLTWNDILPERDLKNLPQWKRGLEAEYKYTDENGKYLYSKLRYTGKNMIIGQTNGGDYRKGRGGAKPTLYRLPELLQAIADGKTVYYTEGEKDVESLRKLGLVATTAGSVSEWKKTFAPIFKDAEVIILPDNDDPGRKLADKVQKDIKNHCKRSKQVITSEAEKGDVTDWINEQSGGGKLKDKNVLVELLAKKCQAVPWIRKEKLQLRKISEIPEEKIQWLEYKFIPKDEITLFAGDGGSGKSSFLYSLIADLSQGRKTIFKSTYPMEEELTGFQRSPKRCMIFSSEDSFSKIIKPKLRQYDADLNMIYGMGVGDPGFTDVKFGSDLLAEVVKEYRPEVVMFDPLQAFLESDVDMGRRNQMRNSLAPLKTLAESYGVTTLIVLHTNKKAGVWGRQRMADSADIWDIARCVYLFGETKNKDSILGTRYISNEKNSYSERQDSLLFNIENGLAVGKSWTEKRDFDFVMEKRFTDENGKLRSPTLESAKEYIVDILKENGGEMLSKDLAEWIKNTIPFSGVTLNRAKAELKKAGVLEYSVTEKGGEWKTKLLKDFIGSEEN